jgi:hypothetical protein
VADADLVDVEVKSGSELFSGHPCIAAQGA